MKARRPIRLVHLQYSYNVFKLMNLLLFVEQKLRKKLLFNSQKSETTQIFFDCSLPNFFRSQLIFFKDFATFCCSSQNDEITISYVPMIVGNPLRSNHIKSEWFFICKCKRLKKKI